MKCVCVCAGCSQEAVGAMERYISRMTGGGDLVTFPLSGCPPVLCLILGTICLERERGCFLPAITFLAPFEGNPCTKMGKGGFLPVS